MRVILPSFAKINLTLRVVNKRADGYHNLVSTFLKIPSGDVLYISESTAGIDIVNANIPISGENIVAKALRIARNEGFKIPPLNIKIHKSIPPGSGLGAGSGNAAAVLSWLKAEKVAAKVGADVPFLCSGKEMAIVSGIGENIESAPKNSLPVHGVVAIPEWQTDRCWHLHSAGRGMMKEQRIRLYRREESHCADRRSGYQPNASLSYPFRRKGNERAICWHWHDVS